MEPYEQRRIDAYRLKCRCGFVFDYDALIENEFRKLEDRREGRDENPCYTYCLSCGKHYVLALREFTADETFRLSIALET